MAEPLYWTEAQIALVEQARDAAQTSARRAQEALGGTAAVVGDVRQMRDRSEEILSEVTTRQADVEDTIAANIPDHEFNAGTGSIRFRNPDGEWGSWFRITGLIGWSPVIAIEADGERRVQKIIDWAGGEGDKPAVDLYVGATGFVADIAEAVDIRGPEGEQGIQGIQGEKGDKGDPGTTDYTELDNLPTLVTDYNELDNLPTLGTAAAEDVEAFATATQGTKADTALQPAAIGTTVQAYDADTAKRDVAQTWTAAQQFSRITATPQAVAALAINCANGNFFTKTISGNSTFTVSNVPGSVSYAFTLKLTYTSGTVTWFSGINWAGAAPPLLAAGKTYLIMFQTDNGGTTWRGAALEFAS